MRVASFQLCPGSQIPRLLAELSKGRGLLPTHPPSPSFYPRPSCPRLNLSVQGDKATLVLTSAAGLTSSHTRSRHLNSLPASLTGRGPPVSLLPSSCRRMFEYCQGPLMFVPAADYLYLPVVWGRGRMLPCFPFIFHTCQNSKTFVLLMSFLPLGFENCFVVRL